MIIKNLYRTALIDPCSLGADELRIVSGYATSAMASRHIEDIQKINPSVKISLLVGMCPIDGIALGNHRGFQQIATNVPNNFVCSYITSPPPVHGKLYIWYQEKQLLKSFIGSANYTQTAFFDHQREMLSEFFDSDVTSYYDSLVGDSIYCNHGEIENHLCVHNDKHYYHRHPNEDSANHNLPVFDTEGLPNVRASLLGKNGRIQRRGGLNWGQRPSRDSNQAYIQLLPEVYRSDFFPPKPQQFTIMTDDSKVLICVRAEKPKMEKGGCVIHSTKNSLMGEYFRNRLGVASGTFVTKEDLERYGRTDVVFYKLDDEHYYMDFSVR